VTSLFERVIGFFSVGDIGVADVVDIVIIAILIYNVLILIRGTRAYQMLLGIIVMVAFLYVSQVLQLRTVNWLLRNFFTYIVIIVIVLFQAEIKKGLASFGRNPFFARVVRPGTEKAVEEIVMACTTLASQRMGAIIAMQRRVGLKNYIEGGVVLDARVTYDLLLSIFNPSSPLHDGAAIVQGNRISAAACFLPLTLRADLSKEFGTRHRAAIGLSEETDAVILVVSEETGIISLVHAGSIVRNLTGDVLKQKVLQHLL